MLSEYGKYQMHMVPRGVQRVTSESTARIVAATHDATAFRLDCDSIRIENRAFALAIENVSSNFLFVAEPRYGRL
jgi:hypothetical protein